VRSTKLKGWDTYASRLSFIPLLLLSFREHTSMLDSDAVPFAHLENRPRKTNPL
jgi:hypothetical protein